MPTVLPHCSMTARMGKWWFNWIIIVREEPHTWRREWNLSFLHMNSLMFISFQRSELLNTQRDMQCWEESLVSIRRQQTRTEENFVSVLCYSVQTVHKYSNGSWINALIRSWRENRNCSQISFDFLTTRVDECNKLREDERHQSWLHLLREIFSFQKLHHYNAPTNSISSFIR